MGYILFLAKHHDGFCLWDTKTTEKKVTNSPLGIDVLAQLRKSATSTGSSWPFTSPKVTGTGRVRLMASGMAAAIPK